jgi:hypothetical protein
MLKREGDSVDAVVIATPDHSHAPAAMSAIKMGKHVFCEKPLAHDVYEVRQLTLAARNACVATQMGIQKHGDTAYREAVKILRKGVLGRIREWHAWSKARYTSPGMMRPAGEDPVPPDLIWDLWIGVAPMRPYKTKVYHPGLWRAWKDFGGGALGDFGCHILDPLFTAVELHAPRTIRAEAPETNEEVWPCWSIVHYEFPGNKRTEGKTLPVTWYDGGKRPPRALAPLPEGEELPEDGSIVIGEDGVMVLPHCAEARLYPVHRFRDFRRPKTEPLNLYAEWVDACKGRHPTSAGFDYAGPLTEAVLLGNVASRFPGKTLEWDSPQLCVTNLPEANACLRRPYRQAWRIPGLSS